MGGECGGGCMRTPAPGCPHHARATQAVAVPVRAPRSSERHAPCFSRQTGPSACSSNLITSATASPGSVTGTPSSDPLPPPLLPARATYTPRRTHRLSTGIGMSLYSLPLKKTAITLNLPPALYIAGAPIEGELELDYQLLLEDDIDRITVGLEGTIMM